MKATNIQRNRVRYLITPAGIAEKARISREYLASSLKFYIEARDRIHRTLARLSENWPEGFAAKTIVFFGAGEVAEIGFVCLHELDLQLVGVVDDSRPTPFLGVPVYPVADLSPFVLGDVSYGRIIVMSFGDQAGIRQRLDDRGIPSGLVEWI